MPIDVMYRSGARFLAVGPRLAVLSSDRTLIERMWPVVRDGGDTVELLVGALGAGLASLTDLVLVEGTAEHIEILVRGDIEADIDSDGTGPVRVDGRGVRTWREAAYDGVRSVSVALGDAAGADLPLRCGTVAADGFRWVPGVAGDVPLREAVAAPVAPLPAGPVAQPADPPVTQPEPSPARVVEAPAKSAPKPVVAARAESSVEETRLPIDDEFGHLFESTILRTPEDAAVRIDPTAGEAAEPAPSAALQLGDHDGETILGSQLAAALAARRQPEAGRSAAPATTGSWELQFSTGQRVVIDGPVIIGRKPQANRFSGERTPTMITVTGPNNDISRSHLEIKPDGDYLLATDLGSTNGTILHGPTGTHPLTAHSPEPCGAGARLDLGDGVTIDVAAAR